MKTYLELQLENLESFYIPLEDVLWFEYKEGSKCLYKETEEEFGGFLTSSDVLIVYKTDNLTSSYDNMYKSNKERPLSSTADSLVGVLMYHELDDGSTENVLDLPHITYIEEHFGVNQLAKQEEFENFTIMTNNYKVFKREYKSLVTGFERHGAFSKFN